MPPKTPDWFTRGYPHIWLPYAQMQTCPAPLPVKSANGVTIKLEDGRELIDGIASWWSVCHGYQHPHIIDAMQKQLQELSHVMFAGLAHEPAYALAERLATLAPEGLERVFFSDSGSTAVEVAMKMAVQYWANKGQAKKHKFLCFRDGYHGDTMGAMSVSDPDSWVHGAFNHHMPKQYVVDIPSGEYSFADFEAVLDDIAKNVAGIIIEPLVQGAGGVKFYSPDVLAEIHRLAKAHDILVIADEVATGFGRTGTMFACEQAGITPDIMCVGKALTGGMIPLAATIATDEVFEAFLSDTMTDALMHGPTYMANPLACAAANASLDLFEGEPRLEQIAAIEAQLWEELKPLENHDRVADVRVMGAIGVVQLAETNWDEIFALRQKFVDAGVWIRPFGDVIYLMPAFTISPDELTQLTAAIKKVLG